MTTPLTLDDTLELSPYGEFNRFAGDKFLAPEIEARGFFGQTFTGAEHLPADVRHLTVEIDTCAVTGCIEGPIDGSTTLDRIWLIGQAVASLIVDTAQGDDDALVASRAKLAQMNLRETTGLSRLPDAIGVPTSWMMEFSGSDRDGQNLVATLAMV